MKNNNPYLRLPMYGSLDFATGDPVGNSAPNYFGEQEVDTTLTEIADTAKNVTASMPEYISKFYEFYTRNMVLISVIQSITILILFIKLSKK